jgi:DNA-directed RNA polymerase specialized sigma24 family protein
MNSGRVFPETRWSIVMAAAHEGESGAHDALALLFRAYWYPLFAHLRAHGHTREEAEDLLQGFFMHLCEKRTFGRADRLKGSFRGFLLGCLKYFLANQREFASARKRGGDARMVSFDVDDAEVRVLADQGCGFADAEHEFDRRWARLIMERALEQLQLAHATRLDVFAALKGFLTGADETRYAIVANQLNVTVSFVKTSVHRMRAEFRDLLRREIAATVSAPHEIDEELRHLIHVLTGD